MIAEPQRGDPFWGYELDEPARTEDEGAEML